MNHGLFETYYRDSIARCERSLGEVYIPSTVFLPEGWSSLEYDVCDGKIKMSILPAMIEGAPGMIEGGLGFGVIRDILLHQSEPWIVEDLSMSSVWYIGILAYADRNFFKILQSYLRDYRSVSKTLNASVTDGILNSVFGIDIIVSQVAGAPSLERIRFLRTVVQKGTTSMLAPFIDAGINLDEGHIHQNYLGHAAGLAKLNFVKMLVDAGADSARAIPVLCQRACELETSVFNSLFSTLLDRLTDLSTADHGNIFDTCDPLQEVLESDRAIDVRPDAPSVLLKKGIFDYKKLFGSEKMFISQSYALSAIRYNRPDALKLLLEYGNPSDLVIGKMYSINKEWFRSLEHYTWLTLAVELGKTACVDVLLKHAKNPADSVIHPDGGGRSALQIALAAAAAPHPRKTVFSPLHWSELKAVEASASQDTAILALLRDALSIEHRNMFSSEARISITNLENHVRSIPSIFRLSSIAKFALSSTTKSCGHGLNSIIELLGSVLHPTPNGFSQIELINACERCPRCGEKHKYVASDAQPMWAQLGQMSVREGLLVALGYFLMYFFIIAHFSLAFALSLTSVRSPGRSIMVGAAILALAMLWKWRIKEL
ncbi:hypothetical protein OEA41_003803 [Lepraria neglecta]|uniref:Uncharacterized protein n=1 Tax=Lepraria neglecta TaxID=209136 RepID=A0AAD9Z4Y4_9LECA|nr:hypothetical protein OEA41_003803 [Lepraria neglecta]